MAFFLVETCSRRHLRHDNRQDVLKLAPARLMPQICGQRLAACGMSIVKSALFEIESETITSRKLAFGIDRHAIAASCVQPYLTVETRRLGQFLMQNPGFWNV